MLSDATLASLRAVQLAAMPDECLIERKTFGARNAFGERTETWTEVATVACRMAAVGLAGGRNAVVTAFRALTTTSDFDLTVPLDTDIRGGDRVTYQGVTFEVAGEPITGTWATAKRVALTRLERG